jgi:hypothetical protein
VTRDLLPLAFPTSFFLLDFAGLAINGCHCGEVPK